MGWAPGCRELGPIFNPDETWAVVDHLWHSSSEANGPERPRSLVPERSAPSSATSHASCCSLREAIEWAFRARVDYVMLVKMYEGGSGKNAPAERRYSPAN